MFHLEDLVISYQIMSILPNRDLMMQLDLIIVFRIRMDINVPTEMHLVLLEKNLHKKGPRTKKPEGIKRSKIKILKVKILLLI